MVDILSYILTGISIAGCIFIAKKNIIGFYLWLISNAGWIIVDWYKDIPAQSLLFLIYFFTTIYSIYEWRKE